MMIHFCLRAYPLNQSVSLYNVSNFQITNEILQYFDFDILGNVKVSSYSFSKLWKYL